MKRLPTTVSWVSTSSGFWVSDLPRPVDVADHYRFRCLVRQREGEQRASVRGPEHLGQEPFGPAAPAARRDDVLLSVDAVRRGAAVVAAATLELEQQLTAVGVPPVELAGRLPAEHEVAARGQQRRAHTHLGGPAPPLLAGARVVGADVSALV